MTTKTLQATLAQLHQELQTTTTLDPASQSLLETVLKDLQRTLQAQQPHPPDAAERIEEAALGFENRHPTLAELARELALALRGAGV